MHENGGNMDSVDVNGYNSLTWEQKIKVIRFSCMVLAITEIIQMISMCQHKLRFRKLSPIIHHGVQFWGNWFNDILIVTIFIMRFGQILISITLNNHL